MSISVTLSDGSGNRPKLNLRFDDPIPDGKHVYEGDVEVAGISHRKAQVIAFAKRQQHSLEFEWEPGNRHDPNAIKVFGRAKGWLFWGRFFLGYLPKETAARIARDGLRGQVSPRLRNIWWGGYVQDFLVVRLDVIGPKPEKPAKSTASSGRLPGQKESSWPRCEGTPAMIEFQCGSCVRRHSVKDAYAGMRAKCPCGSVLVVPNGSAPRSPVAPAPAEAAGSGDAVEVEEVVEAVADFGTSDPAISRATDDPPYISGDAGVEAFREYCERCKLVHQRSECPGCGYDHTRGVRTGCMYCNTQYRSSRNNCRLCNV